MRADPYVACYQNSEWVQLTDEQINEAARHGRRMRETSLREGHREHGMWGGFTNEQAMRSQQLGAVAEAAVKIALGVKAILKSEVFQEPDLPGNVEVRLIGEDHWGLRIYEKDIAPIDKRPRHVVGVIIPRGQERGRPYRLPGWYHAGWKIEEWWWINPHNRRRMCAVPQVFLHPLWALRALLHQEGIEVSDENTTSSPPQQMEMRYE